MCHYSFLPAWFINPHFTHFLGAIWEWPPTAAKELAINPHFVDFVWCNMWIAQWIQRKMLKAQIQSLYWSLLCAQHSYTHTKTHTHMHKHKHWNTWNRWFMRINQWKEDFFLSAWLLLGTLLLMLFVERKADCPFLNTSWYGYQLYSEVMDTGTKFLAQKRVYKGVHCSMYSNIP